MSGEAFALGVLSLLTILLSVVIWSVFATARARARAGDDGRQDRDVDELRAEVARLRDDLEHVRRSHQ